MASIRLDWVFCWNMDKEDYMNLSLMSLLRLFNRINGSVVGAINESFDIDLVHNRFDNLRKHWNIILLKYEQEFEAERLDMTNFDEEWIKSVQEQFDRTALLCNQYEKTSAKDLIRESDNKHLEEKIEKLAERLIVEKQVLINYKTNLERLILQERCTRNVESIERMYVEFRGQFDICKHLHVKHSSLLKSVGVIVDENSENGIQELLVIVNEVYVFMEKLSDESKIMETVKPNSNKLKLERMKLPTFSGHVREFARFKSDFEQYVEPKLNASDVPYVLKTCLQGEPYDIVKNLEDNSQLIWNRLCERYGTPIKVVKSVLDDIRMYSALEDRDDIGFLKFVQKIEAGLNDLRRLGLELELCNSNVISEIEKKLPPTIRREWSTKVIENEKENSFEDKFNELFEFLKHQRNALEYRCYPQTFDCSEVLNNDDRMREFNQKRDNSFVLNHVIESPINEDAKSHWYRCPLHQTNQHTLEDCKTFMNANVKDKMSIVFSARACWNCLLPGHKSRNCRRAKGCTQDGCKMWHHDMLHECHVNGHNFGSVNA